MDPNKDFIEFMSKIAEDTLWDFYVRNDICEAGHGKEKAVRPLQFDSYTVGAFHENKLAGFIRALFDGLSADIMEFCLECELQGENLRYENGSIIEKDEYGIARKMGILLIDELKKLGNTFVTAYAVTGIEENIYKSIGLVPNTGHTVFVRDERPYITD